MKYFSGACNAKTKISRVNVDLTQGLRLPQNKKGNSAQDMINFSSDMYPWLVSRGRLRRRKYPLKFNNGAGINLPYIYNVQDGKFFYNRQEMFKVSEGNKNFYHYNGKIIICPDMIYYDPETEEYGKFGITTDEITYKISKRTVGSVDFGLSSIHSDDAVLTDYFKVGDGIKITDEEGLGISGFHTITAVNREDGTLFFDKFEFGDGEGFTLTGRLSHGAPERCDAACICGGRVWVASGNKIQASTINDERNWAIGGDDEKSSFICDFDNGETITACIEFEGNPVFFSEKKIYKVYGDRASNFYLKCCSNWGGVPKRMSNTVSIFKDKIFYLSEHGVTYFDGNSPKLLEDTPFSITEDAFAASDGKNYFVFVNDGSKILYVYDGNNNQWQKYDGCEFIGFVTYNGGVYGYTQNSICWLWGSPDLFEQYGLEDVPYHFVDFLLDINGRSPFNVVLDVECDETADFEISISYDSDTTRTLLKTLRGVFEGKIQIPIIPKSCKSIRIALGGKGSIIIKELYVDVMG